MGKVINPVNRILGTPGCPNCTSTDKVKMGMNRFRGETEYKCLNCGTRYKTNEYD